MRDRAHHGARRVTTTAQIPGFSPRYWAHGHPGAWTSSRLRITAAGPPGDSAASKAIRESTRRAISLCRATIRSSIWSGRTAAGACTGKSVEPASEGRGLVLGASKRALASFFMGIDEHLQIMG